jgi:ubiquinone/menaquinone biosynthesis C-methylase UbiE
MEGRMRASMAEGCRHGRSTSRDQFGDPRGVLGWTALAAMALKNGGQNQAAIGLLDLKAGESVLELGCGPGMGVRRALREVGPKGFVAGADQSGCAAHFAQLVVHRAILRGNAAVMCAPAADLPFRDLMFDKAFAVNSFQFWPDPARALREIARVLAPEGRLVITQRASREDRPSKFAGAAEGMERIAQANTLLRAQGWRLLDERLTQDGSRLMAACVLAEKPPA